MNRAFIVSGKRTPIGSLLGYYKNLKATQLSSLTLSSIISSTSLDPSQISEIILGNVLSTGLGQNPGRQASLGAEIPKNIPCWNINKVCASGMKSVTVGATNIFAGFSQVVLAGGFESMTNAPHFSRVCRSGVKFGNFVTYDCVASDGLTDAYSNLAMGFCAEKTAREFGVGREIQDEYCVRSYERVFEAEKNNLFRDEIVPVDIPKFGLVSKDEEPLRYKPDKISTLKPVFPDKDKNGTITGANASKINDGACSLLLMSENALKENGMSPLVEVVSFADAETDPLNFNCSPTIAVQKALKRANLKIGDIDYWEINEAFSVTPIVNMKLLEINHDIVNVHGGAVALGHPVGASGARIILSLITVLRERGGKYGCAAICNGGGGSTAIIVKNIE